MGKAKKGILALVLFALSATALADYSIVGKVIKVVDGDTVTILKDRKQFRIRLLGIDAPESHQAYGNVSRKRLNDLVYDKTVEAACIEKDFYGRDLCKIIIGGTDINLEMIRAGLAWHYTKGKKSQTNADRRAYQLAEREAREQKIGLWQDKKPTPPWDFRRNRKK